MSYLFHKNGNPLDNRPENLIQVDGDGIPVGSVGRGGPQFRARRFARDLISKLRKDNNTVTRKQGYKIYRDALLTDVGINFMRTKDTSWIGEYNKLAYFTFKSEDSNKFWWVSRIKNQYRIGNSLVWCGWGKIGTNGQNKLYEFDATAIEDITFIRKKVDEKLAKGYQLEPCPIYLHKFAEQVCGTQLQSPTPPVPKIGGTPIFLKPLPWSGEVYPTYGNPNVRGATKKEKKKEEPAVEEGRRFIDLD